MNASHPRASGSQIVTNLHYLPSWGANMLGVGGGQLGNGGVPVALEAVHLIGLFVVTGGIIAGSRGNGQRGDSWAGVAGAVRARRGGSRTFSSWRCSPISSSSSVLTTSDDPGFLRYLTAAVIFGTVLAGRWVGRLAASLPSARS